MTALSKRLEQIVRKELAKNLIPIKTSAGILVGDILISSKHNLKFIYRNSQLIYPEIHLNSAAIKIANLLSMRKSVHLIEKIYAADQEYGRWFTDSQLYHTKYLKAAHNRDFERAETLWVKYCQGRDRCLRAKINLDALLRIE